jgi:hypothetical protein
MKDPLVITDLLSKEDFEQLQEYVKGLDKSTLVHSTDFNRYEFGGSEFLNSLHNKLITAAKDFFESDTLVPSFNFGSWYYGQASLEKHKDIAACTYSIDLCVYQKTPWDLYVEGIPYALQENQALMYYGEAQRHWREDFPNPEDNVVCNVFFFYVEPDHWSIIEPEEKHDMIRRQNAMERNLS